MTGPQVTDQTGVKTLVKGANDASDSMKKEMLKAAMDLDFEKAAQLRDKIKKIESLKMELFP